MLLSFKPEVFEAILSGKKIYEHRRVFPDGPIKAYIYISKPVQAVTGIMHLGNKISLLEWKQKYFYDTEANARIDKYLERYKFAMEIQNFQNTNKIPLTVIKKEFPNFLIPQMYYFIDDTPLLEYLKKNLTPEGEFIQHEFTNISSDMICIR